MTNTMPDQSKLHIKEIQQMSTAINDAILQHTKTLESIELVDFNALNIIDDIDPIDELKLMKLLLEYRFHTHHSLQQLLQLETLVCQTLGISPQHPLSINIERLIYAVGSESLELLLTQLKQLIDLLIHLATQLKQNRNALKISKRANLFVPKSSYIRNQIFKKTTSNIHNLIHEQIESQELMKTLIARLEYFGGQTQPGPILDHISALQGPISRFYQCMQHGINTNLKLIQQLKPIEQFQNKFKPALEPVAPAASVIPTIKPSPQELEQRAHEKRLGNFFRGF